MDSHTKTIMGYATMILGMFLLVINALSSILGWNFLSINVSFAGLIMVVIGTFMTKKPKACHVPLPAAPAKAVQPSEYGSKPAKKPKRMKPKRRKK